MKKVLPLLLILVLACGQKPKEPSPQEKIHSALTKFFTAETYPGRQVVGLWLTDEKQPRMPGAVFFRIGANGSYQRLTIRDQNISLDRGRLKSIKITDSFEEYEATIQGEKISKAKIQVDKKGGGARFIFLEGSKRIEATRETALTADLVKRYELFFQTAAGLPQQ